MYENGIKFRLYNEHLNSIKYMYLVYYKGFVVAIEERKTYLGNDKLIENRKTDKRKLLLEELNNILNKEQQQC